MNFVDFKYAILLTLDGWDLKLEVQKNLKTIMRKTDRDSYMHKQARKFYRELFPIILYHQISDVVDKWEYFSKTMAYKKLAYPEIYGADKNS